MTHDSLLQAIIDSPDDDSLRLVYADFLEESGEPERATFIRVQIELANLPEAAERRASLEAKERVAFGDNTAASLHLPAASVIAFDSDRANLRQGT